MMNILRIDSISLQRSTVTILDNIQWKVQSGEHWAIIGGNGAGKTTLLDIINGYVWPTSGTVEVLGAVYGRVNLADVRKNIGWVSANMSEKTVQSRPNELSLNVVISGKYASIGMWVEPSEEDAKQALELLRIFECADLAEKPFHVLSQGEKQRVMIARAWMAEPKLMILDEPCTGLDVKAREDLLVDLSALVGREASPSLLYVTHHPEEVLPFFTHAIILKHGRVLASGKKEEVITSDRLSEAFDVPVEVVWQANRPWVHVLSDSYPLRRF